MRKVFISLSFIALAMALPASAQMQPKSLARIIIVKPNPGMAAQWEQGIKQVNDWAHQHNRPFTLYVWAIVSGPRTGQYALGTFGHDWKDFDAVAEASQGLGKEIAANLEPSTASHLTSYWEFRQDLTGRSVNLEQTPPPFAAVVTFFLKIGGEQNVEGAIKAGGAAAQSAHWQGKPSEWYTLVNGGFEPEMALVMPRQNWADFQPPAKTFFDMLSDVLGKEGFAALRNKFNSGVRAVRSEIWAYRPDLSYIPASQ
jgi:hypothetical protein